MPPTEEKEQSEPQTLVQGRGHRAPHQTRLQGSTLPLLSDAVTQEASGHYSRWGLTSKVTPEGTWTPGLERPSGQDVPHHPLPATQLQGQAQGMNKCFNSASSLLLWPFQKKPGLLGTK